MKVDELERLLTAYYEGNTDECEEERLKQALRTEELPEHLLSDKRIVLAMEDGLAEEVSVPRRFLRQDFSSFSRADRGKTLRPCGDICEKSRLSANSEMLPPALIRA